MARKMRWLMLVGVALVACACAGGGDDKEGQDLGPRWWLDLEGETAVPDTQRPPADLTPQPDATPTELPGDQDVVECVPDCEGKECGDDDGCGKFCVVHESCEGNPPCGLGICDPSGVCALQPQAGECDDGNACTVGDTCGGARCKPGPEWLHCDDENPCTNDGCTPDEGCYFDPNTAPCDDGDPCTVGDTCQAGSCISWTPNLCEDNNPCTDDWCHETEGCLHDAVGDGVACDDNNVCTQYDQCSGGQCVPGQLKECGDGNPCTVDSCNPQTGCAYANAPNGTACNDGDACTDGDQCVNGVCFAGGEKDCNDNNPCTNDSCANGQCQHEPLTGDFFCDDGNPCTEPDWCEDGVCQPGPTLPGCG